MQSNIKFKKVSKPFNKKRFENETIRKQAKNRKARRISILIKAMGFEAWENMQWDNDNSIAI